MSTRLILVRHGESVWNAERRIQGQADPPLSPRGLVQAYALAETLSTRPLAAIYSSSLQRARTTASYIAAPHDLHPIVVEALREMHLGSWQGRICSDIDAVEGNSTASSTMPLATSGETLGQVRERVAPALDALLDAHRNDTIALVTHSIVGRVILCQLLGAGLDLVPRLKLKQGSVSLVRLDGHNAVLERLGDIGHLAPMAMQNNGQSSHLTMRVVRP